MELKKKLKKGVILKTLNILVLLAIIGFYSYRLVHYYLLENKPQTSNEPVYIIDKILKKESFVDLTKGLVRDEETNVLSYKGDVKDNYLSYKGILFRIVSIDNEENIKLISDSEITQINPGLEKGFNDSYLYSYLNSSDDYGVFYNVVKNEEILRNTYICNDEIIELNDITCENYESDNLVTVLSINDYITAGGKNSYLNNNSMYALLNINEEKNTWYINEEGNIGLSNVSRFLGIRPVITINGELEYISGDGKENNPYIIELSEKKDVASLEINDIIMFDDYTYKVINKDETKTKIVMTSALNINEEDVEKVYSTKDNRFDTKSGIGKYLNNDFYNSLENKDFLVKGKFYTGAYSGITYDYKDVFKENIESYVGLLSLGELFINEVEDTFLITPSKDAKNVIFTFNKEGHIYGDLINNKHKLRPSLYIKNDLAITGGKGTQLDPFTLGGLDGE